MFWERDLKSGAGRETASPVLVSVVVVWMI